jgi:sugar-specific transcriptional regulator TrmB
MRLTADRLRILLEHGLSEYQARVYLALLEFPSLPAGALAKAAQIPRNRLYEVLEELQGLGLVEIILGETRSYRAQPFTVYLERSVSELRDRVEALESKKAYLGAAFSPPELTESSDLDAGMTRVLLTRRAVAREIDRLLEGATQSLVAVGSEGGWERILHHFSRYQGKPPAHRVEIVLPPSAARSGGIERLGEAFLPFVSWLPV